MLQVLLVAIGGGIGSVTRYLVGGWFASRFGVAFPYGTLVINVTGSFIIGLFLTFAQDRIWFGPNWHVFFAVGLVGGYTTFSTFEYETIRLLQNGQVLSGVVYLIGSVLTGTIATIAGIALGSSIQ